MHFSIIPVPLESIELNDEWNLHPWELNEISLELQDSFYKTGVMHPPVILQSASNTFSIIHGFKRVLYCKTSSKINNLVCLTISKNASPAYILNLLLENQLCSFSPLSLAEKARFLIIAARSTNRETIFKKYLSRLQLKKIPSSYYNTIKIMDQDEEIIREIHYGKIKEKMVSEILKLRDPADRIALIQLFKQLSLGDGKQRKFFVLLRDLAFRHETTIGRYLDKSAIQEILNHKEMNIPQIIQHFGFFLQNEYAPSSHKAEEIFHNQVKEMLLPDNCSLSHTKSFEKDLVTLSITFRNMVDCKEKWAVLKHIVSPE